MRFLFCLVRPLYSDKRHSPPHALGTAATLSEVDTYVKVVVAAVTGLGTLLGLPIILLTYRKTRAEITKLELESTALRERQLSQGDRSQYDGGNIRILVDHSPNASIQILADPRFLAPLLVLLDFIFAWVVLTLANYLLQVFDLGIFRDVGIVVLAMALLLPISRQVLRVRTVLRPQRSLEEVRASIRQTRMVVYTLYALLGLSSLGFGALLFGVSNVTTAGRYLAWFLLGWGTLLLLLLPVGKPRFERYLTKLYSADTA